jgi:hypothetical protein
MKLARFLNAGVLRLVIYTSAMTIAKELLLATLIIARGPIR